jgi:hypothetical protein
MKFTIEVELKPGHCDECCFTGAESCPCKECGHSGYFSIVDIEEIEDGE